MSLLQSILNVRLGEVKRMLPQTNLPIADIARRALLGLSVLFHVQGRRSGFTRNVIRRDEAPRAGHIVQCRPKCKGSNPATRIADPRIQSVSPPVGFKDVNLDGMASFRAGRHLHPHRDTDIAPTHGPPRLYRESAHFVWKGREELCLPRGERNLKRRDASQSPLGNASLNSGV